jgi:hypothetical protein
MQHKHSLSLPGWRLWQFRLHVTGPEAERPKRWLSALMIWAQRLPQASLSYTRPYCASYWCGRQTHPRRRSWTWNPYPPLPLANLIKALLDLSLAMPVHRLEPGHLKRQITLRPHQLKKGYSWRLWVLQTSEAFFKTTTISPRDLQTQSIFFWNHLEQLLISCACY